MAPSIRASTQGFAALAGVAANVFLGASSLFWKELGAISPLTLLAYRILVSLVTLTILMSVLGRFAGFRAKLTARTMAIHICAAGLVVTNWGVFIWASIQGHVIESGLGYLVAPFVAIGIGAVVFQEAMTALRWGALLTIVSSVLMLMRGSGELDHWIYLAIGASWGGYACLKKITPLDPFAGLLAETSVLAFVLTIPLATSSITLCIPHDVSRTAFVLLAFCGVVSVFPLWLFAYAAGRLPLSGMGFLQFVLPATQFIVALTIYKQDASTNTIVCFGFISAALLMIASEPIVRRYAWSAKHDIA